MAPVYSSLNPVVFSLYVIPPPSWGVVITETQGYNGAAVGKGRQLAKTELEKLKLPELSLREAVIEAARM